MHSQESHPRHLQIQVLGSSVFKGSRIVSFLEGASGTSWVVAAGKPCDSSGNQSKSPYQLLWPSSNSIVAIVHQAQECSSGANLTATVVKRKVTAAKVKVLLFHQADAIAVDPQRGNMTQGPFEPRDKVVKVNATSWHEIYCMDFSS